MVPTQRQKVFRYHGIIFAGILVPDPLRVIRAANYRFIEVSTQGAVLFGDFSKHLEFDINAVNILCIFEKFHLQWIVCKVDTVQSRLWRMVLLGPTL